MKIIKIIVDHKPESCKDCLLWKGKCFFNECYLIETANEKANPKSFVVAYMVCNYFDVSFDVVHRKTRKTEIKDVRHIIYYFLNKYKEKLNMSKIRIGMMFDQSHATVIHAVNAVNNHYDVEPEYRENILRLDKLIEPILKDC